MISILIPFHNEEENVPILLEQLTTEMNLLKEKYEFIFIDDGSTDKSFDSIRSQVDDVKVKLVRQRKKLGKGAALNAGLKHSTGDIIIFMDADLQDDPKDLTKFISKMNEGYDLVNGYRANRKDTAVIKMYSGLANKFLHSFLESPFSDINCGFKAFRRTVLDNIPLYANNFRFLPLAAFYRGYKVTEVEVNNQPRLYGKSKFGTKKLFIGLMDTMTAYFLYQFAERPLHFFGMIGGSFFTVGFFTALILTFQKFAYDMQLYRRPALLFAVLMIIVGIQIIMTGILGELIVYWNKKKSN